jgi:hypothetical protein
VRESEIKSGFCLQYQVKSKELIEVSSPSSDVLQALVSKRKKKKTMKIGKGKKNWW